MDRVNYCGLFAVAVGRPGDDPDEVAGKLVDWLQENAGGIDEDDVQVIGAFESSEGFEGVLKTGDRVKARVEGEEWIGTIVGIHVDDDRSLVARVRFDNGALRLVHLNELTLLGQSR